MREHGIPLTWLQQLELNAVMDLLHARERQLWGIPEDEQVHAIIALDEIQKLDKDATQHG